MSNVLIRDVAPDDLKRIKAAAAENGTSLQAYLSETLRAQAAFLRRRDALDAIAERLEVRDPVPESARAAVLDKFDAAALEIRIEGTPWDDVQRAHQLAQGSLRYTDGVDVAAAERHETGLLTADARIGRSGADITCEVITFASRS